MNLGLTKSKPLFRLEMLESRMLLAGDDSKSAFISSGPFLINIDHAETDAVISVATVGGGNLTIDSNLLPAKVSSLSISGFNSVTVVGDEKIPFVEISLVGNFSAPGLDITNTLRLSSVSSVSIHSITGFAWLTAGSATRLEVFDARSATIFSTLDKLTINSSNDVYVISGNPKQEFHFEFQTNSLPIGPLLSVVMPGELATEKFKRSDGAVYSIFVLTLPDAATEEGVFIRLQTAIKQQDSASIKSIFSELMKASRVSTTAFTASYLVPLDSEFMASDQLRQFRKENLAVDLAGFLPDRALSHSEPPTQPNLHGTATPVAGDNDGNELWKTHRVQVSLVEVSPLPSSGIDTTPARMLLIGNSEAPGPLEPIDKSAVDKILASLDSGRNSYSRRDESAATYIIRNTESSLRIDALPVLIAESKSSRIGGNRNQFQIGG